MTEKRLAATRVVGAPADAVFALLATPATHGGARGGQVWSYRLEP